MSEEIATTAGAGGGVPKLQLGFRHSGYTGSDVDGRNALLTLSVVDRSSEVLPADLNVLTAHGYSVDKSFSLNTSNDWMLDVQLADDVVEEQRIRTLLHLPIRINVGATVIPVSIRWSNVDGDKLYLWLTDPKNGLKFILTNGSIAKWNMMKTPQLSLGRFATWWGANATGASISWEGDATSLLVQLAGSGVFFDSSDPTRVLSVSDLAPSFPELVRKLGPICQTSGRNTSVTRQSLEDLDWRTTSQYQIMVPMRVESGVSPGVALLAHPDLVIDLTNGNAGLGAIRSSSNAPLSKPR